jgi:hypothetical protein
MDVSRPHLGRSTQSADIRDVKSEKMSDYFFLRCVASMSMCTLATEEPSSGVASGELPAATWVRLQLEDHR